MRLKTSTICLLLLSASLAAQSASPADSVARLDRLAESLNATDFTRSANRGWEGDPRAGSWVTVCDRGDDANACWLVGIELSPFLTVGLSASNRQRYDYVTQRDGRFASYANILGVRYLQRGCDLARRKRAPISATTIASKA